MPLSRNLADVFLMIILVFGKEDHRRKALFSSYHIKGTYYQYNLSMMMMTVDVDLDRLAEVMFVRVFHYIGTLFYCLDTVLFGSKSLCAAHTEKVGALPFCASVSSFV